MYQNKTFFYLLACLTISLFQTACASQKPRGFELPPALSETFRGGALKGLEAADSPELGMPNQYDRVSHTCVSTPVYRIDGIYLRTDVRCW